MGLTFGNFSSFLLFAVGAVHDSLWRESHKAGEQIESLNLNYWKYGGRDRVRTCDPLLAKQVLSQLSYTPTVEATFILKHFRALGNPFLRFFTIWSEPLF